MKHLILFFMFSFFVLFSQNIYAKTEQIINEYKIEQLQKSMDEIKKEIDELKKDVDDTKEKKVENKKDNESLDKRISDINGNVDRFGIIAGVLGLLITIGLVAIGFISYRNAKADAREVAKEEAEKMTNNWLNNEAKQRLNEMMTKLENEAKRKIAETVQNAIKQQSELENEAKRKIAEAVQNAKDEIKQQSEAEDLFLQGRSYHLNNEYEKAKEYYKKAVDAGHTGALNNLGALSFSQERYEEADEYLNKALALGDNRIFFNLGLLYSEDKYKNKDYEKAEEYYLKAIESRDNDALNNLKILYTEQNEHTKLEELKQKYKI